MKSSLKLRHEPFSSNVRRTELPCDCTPFFIQLNSFTTFVRKKLKVVSHQFYFFWMGQFVYALYSLKTLANKRPVKESKMIKLGTTITSNHCHKLDLNDF